MKLLVTGSNGFVAGSVMAQAPETWELHGIARAEIPVGRARGIYHSLDLLDAEKLDLLFHELKPDAVIHTAAMANIDACEREPGQAEAVNIGVTERLAALCRETDAKLVFCSTDSIFDGKKGHYSETDIPVPLNVYARTKIQAEQFVLAASDKNAVTRLSLVMGLPVGGQGNSFLADTLTKLKSGQTILFPENEIRTPIDVITLGAALVELAGNEFGGILHLAGNTRIDRYRMALQIAGSLGFPQTLIQSVNSNAIPGRAPRPDDASLDNSRARQTLRTPMLSLKEGLDLTMNSTF